MNLDSYLKRKGMSTKAFADKHGFSYATVWRIRNRKVIPRPEMAMKISIATGGEVSVVELLFPNENSGQAGGASR